MSKILYIIPYLSIGGTEKHLLDLITHFEGEHELFLLAPDDETKDQFLERRLTFYNFKRLDLNLLKGLKEFIANLKIIIKNHAIELIHIHGAPELIILVKMVTRNIPIIFTVHGFHGPRKHLDYRGCAWVCNRFASQVIAVAKAEEEILLKNNIKPGLITTVHNGVPDPLQNNLLRPEILSTIPEDKLIIGAIARLETTKGINYLLEAFSSVLQTYPNLHLVIVGSGSKESELLALTSQLGLTNDVTFTGYQRNVHDYLHSYNIFIIPSLHEAHPLVLMEGMAHGKPIIATTVGGIPEVIHQQQNGLLIPPADSKSLANALKELLANPHLAAEIGYHARQTYEENYTVGQMVAKTREIYNHFLHNQ